MERTLCLLALWVAVGALGGCTLAGGPERKATLHSASEFQRTFATLCLAPPSIADDVTRDAGKRQMLETAISEALVSRGYAVVPSTKTAPIVRAASEGVGGIYDPIVGTLDRTRLSRARLAALAQMHRDLGCDAYVEPAIEVVWAPFRETGAASWDGVVYQVFGLPGLIGRIPALSLWITIVDLNDREIYFGTGGIQLLGTITGNQYANRFWPSEEKDILFSPQAIALAARNAIDGIDPGFVPVAP